MSLTKSWLFGRQRLQVCHPGILCEALEERIVLDAAVATSTQNQTNHIDQIQTPDVALPVAVPIADQGYSTATPDASCQGTDNLSTAFQTDLHVILISDALDKIQVISDAAEENTRVAVINDVGDNLDSVNRLLAEMVSSTGQKIGNLSILSHGTEGLVTLGSDHINEFNLNDFRFGLENLSTLMTADAQIHLYGCSVAGNDLGKALIEGLALYSGADVFASTDPTGGSEGNWTLEYASNPNIVMLGILDTDRLSSVDISLAAPYPAYENNWGTSMGGVFYFVNDDGVHGKELWAVQANGDPWMVKDINTGAADSNPSELTVYNGALYFSATDGNNPTSNSGVELWRSDGTEAGTYLVKDINPGGNKDSNPRWLTVSNGWLYFSAIDGTGGSSHGNELFRTDGTEANTLLVADINLGHADSNPSHLVDVNDTLYFSATDGTTGNELWRSNGTGPGTWMVKEIRPGNQGSDPAHLLNANGILYFSATDGNSGTAHGNELWKSDGSEAGTIMVKDINQGNLGSNPAELFYDNGILFFSASDGGSAGAHGTELWKTTGTEAGTEMVADINPGLHGSNPSGLAASDGVIYFAADDGTHGIELWKTDGAASGTVMVMDINPGTADSTPRFLNDYNGELLFSADDGTHGYELWNSDGTLGGTFLLQDINPAGSSFPLNFGRLNPLFFLADDGRGFKLWKSDGTVSGTIKVSDVPTGSIVVSGGQPGDAGGTTGQTNQTSGNPGNAAAIDAGRSLMSRILGEAGKESTRLSEGMDKSPVPLYNSLESKLEAAAGARFEVLQGRENSSQAISGSPPVKGTTGSLESASNTVTGFYAQEDARPTEWGTRMPAMIKVIVLENGDYSVRTDLFALVVGVEVWTPPMVRWYLSALSEGRYRPGSLPAGFERMIWDFLQYSASRKTEGQTPLSDMEAKLAWQWAEWRRQLSKARGNVEVLPWDYFNGLSKAMILFYGGGGAGDVDLGQAVNAMQQNIRNLSIIPLKLPDELLSRYTNEPAVR